MQNNKNKVYILHAQFHPACIIRGILFYVLSFVKKCIFPSLTVDCRIVNEVLNVDNPYCNTTQQYTVI
jgi:hypothetical protein